MAANRLLNDQGTNSSTTSKVVLFAQPPPESRALPRRVYARGSGAFPMSDHGPVQVIRT